MNIIPKGFVGFLDDDQKLAHQMSVSGFSPHVYRHKSFVKIYEGAEILIYHFDGRDRLTLDTVLVCTGFTISDKIMQASVVNRKDFRVANIGVVPNKIVDFDLLTSVPVRCTVERTMKITRSGSLITGSTAALLFQSKSGPDQRIVDHYQACSLTQVKKRFSTREFSDAENRAAMAA